MRQKSFSAEQNPIKYQLNGKSHFFYSWKPEPTDKLPKEYIYASWLGRRQRRIDAHGRTRSRQGRDAKEHHPGAYSPENVPSRKPHTPTLLGKPLRYMALVYRKARPVGLQN